MTVVAMVGDGDGAPIVGGGAIGAPGDDYQPPIITDHGPSATMGHQVIGHEAASSPATINHQSPISNHE